MTITRNESAGKLSRRALAKQMTLGIAAAALPSSALGEEALSHSASAFGQTVIGQQIESSWVPVFPGVWRMRAGSPEPFTPTALRYFQPAADRMHSVAAFTQPPLPVPAATITRRGTMVRLPLRAQENIFGFGLQMLSFNQRGKKKTLRVNADPKMDTGDSHAPVPFYVSSLGYGVFVDTARYATFCCGNTQQVGQLIGGTDRAAYTESAPKLEDSDNAEIEVQIDGAPGIDIYLFAGPTMLDAVRRFNLFSGGGVNPPEWGLGFWYRPRARATSEEVLRLAREFRERKIPCDVFGLEAGWQTHAYSCTYLWSADFPDPAQFVQAMTRQNYKVNLWEHAFVNPRAPFYDAIAPSSGDHLVWRGLVPDFTAKQARKIFGEHHRKTLLDIGICGFKLDECDNSDYTGGWSFPEFSQFPSGQDGEQMHSVFGLKYQQTILEQYKAEDVPTYGLVRSSGALAAPYPFVLYSDLYDHRAFVRTLANSGFSGLLWCPEVRDAKGPDDLVRRLQTAVFSPLAMINGWYITNPPWKQQDRKKNNANDLTPGWEVLEARCREVLEWRMLLLPYLRAAFALYAEDGTPPFRALIMDDPGNAALATCDDQFLLGDRMMVAPLFDGENGRKVVIPKGEWHDFWTGAAVAGGQTTEVSSSYARIPVYVKTGSVLPVGGVAASTADRATRVLTVRIFGDGSLPFAIGSGEAPELLLTWDGGNGRIEQHGSSRPYTVSGWVPSTKQFL